MRIGIGLGKKRVRGTTGTGFEYPNGGPDAIPNLMAWWDASSGVTTTLDEEGDEKLVSWEDRKAGRVAVTPSEFRSPVFSAAIGDSHAISFTKDIADYSGAPALNEFTALVVFRQNAFNGNNAGPFRIGKAGLNIGGTGSGRWSGIGNSSPAEPYALNEVYISALSVKLAGGFNIARLNDSEQVYTSNWAGNNTDLWRLGVTSGYTIDSDISQACVWNRALSSAELQQVFEDFGAQFGVGV